MKKTQFSLFMAAAALLVMTGGLRAQTSVQRLTFSLLAAYQTNTFHTNTSSGLTNENMVIHDILIGTDNIVRAIAVDLDGTNTTTPNWYGSDLVREVNLTTGNEGIYLRKNGSQTNVSSFFAGSFSNNFTAGLTNAFPAVNTNLTEDFTNSVSFVATNIVTNVDTNGVAFTNVFTNVFTNAFTNGLTNAVVSNFGTNFSLQLPLVHGQRVMTSPTTTATNILSTAGLYFISFNSANIRFDLLGVGDGNVTKVHGFPVYAEILGSAGTFYLNGTSNIFNMGEIPPFFFAGPARGSVILGQPVYFGSIQPPEGP